MKVRKAIIPAAGLGTRFLPATKAQPKEMLPIVDKPTIQYIIEEAVAAGIEEIMIISGRNKRSIEDHFDYTPELEAQLEHSGKVEQLEQVRKIAEMVDIQYVRQKRPLGLGHAIHCAHSFIEGEPFAVLLGDDIAVCKTPAIGQLIEVYNKYQKSVIGVSCIPKEETYRYGVITPDENFHGEPGVFKVNSLVEKPQPQDAPSNYAIFGRYVITPDIMQILENVQPGKGGEIQLTDALNVQANAGGIYALDFEGLRYDVGQKLGFLRATVEFALAREDIREEFSAYLRRLIQSMDEE